MKDVPSIVARYAKPFPKTDGDFEDMCAVKFKLGECQLIFLAKANEGEAALTALRACV